MKAIGFGKAVRNGGWTLLVLVCCSVVALVPVATQAAPRVEADPNKSYRVTPELGPWVILCASYTGEAAKDLAREVTLCLRRRDNLPAYVFDWGAQRREKQERELAELRAQHKTIQKVSVPDECAVCVGGFPDQDSALSALKAIKKLAPPEVNLGPNVLPYQVLKYELDPKTGKYHAVAINPFANSVAVPNPTVPVNTAKKPDPFIKELNRGEHFSLLDNKAPWTLVVQIYTGAVSIVAPGGANDIFGRQTEPRPGQRSVLEASTLQARETARVLRLVQCDSSGHTYEAYVLHTRESSVVAVGGFSSPKDPEMIKLAEFMSQDQRLKQMRLLPLEQMFALEVPRP